MTECCGEIAEVAIESAEPLQCSRTLLIVATCVHKRASIPLERTSRIIQLLTGCASGNRCVSCSGSILACGEYLVCLAKVAQRIVMSSEQNATASSRTKQ